MRRPRREGFTLTELAICLSLLAILVPTMYAYALGIEDRFSVGMWHLETADQVRTVSESLHIDQQNGALLDDMQFLQGDCIISYRLEGDVLVRATSCGEDQALARGVSDLIRKPTGVELHFTRAIRASRAQHSQIFIPLEASCSADM